MSNTENPEDNLEENLDLDNEELNEEDVDLAGWGMGDDGDSNVNVNNPLDQDEIDMLLGVSAEKKEEVAKTGIEELLEKSMESYEKLPILEIIFDRFIRTLSNSLRTLSSESIDIDLVSMESLRLSHYLNTVAMPSLISIFQVVEWEGIAMIHYTSQFVYNMVEMLFGGKKNELSSSNQSGRPYSNIEKNIMKHITNIILYDLSTAFDQITPSTFKFDRFEINPRFATIARPADGIILLKLRISMEERDAIVEIVIPYMMLDPIKELLQKIFLTENSGSQSDREWSYNFANIVKHSQIQLEVRMNNKNMLLSEINNLQIGDIIHTDQLISDPLNVFSSHVFLGTGQLGQFNDKLAVSLTQFVVDSIDLEEL